MLGSGYQKLRCLRCLLVWLSGTPCAGHVLCSLLTIAHLGSQPNVVTVGSLVEKVPASQWVSQEWSLEEKESRKELEGAARSAETPQEELRWKEGLLLTGCSSLRESLEKQTRGQEGQQGELH